MATTAGPTNSTTSRTNPYAKAPLYVASVDPLTGRYQRAFFFLGAAPRAVLGAVRRGRPAARDARRYDWDPADGRILRGFYGPHWRELLTAEDPPPAAAAAPVARGSRVTGGDPSDLPQMEFGDLGELDDIGGTDDAAGQRGGPPVRRRRDIDPDNWESPTDGSPVYTDIAVYPEDTIDDLRLKLSLASGVPLYRQHFFYYMNEEGPAHPYRIAVDGVPAPVDWRDIAAGPGDRHDSGASGTVVAGVNVDPRLEERREGIRVEALDTFTALSPVLGVRLTRAYFVDLYNVVRPAGGALAAIMRDRYQFDLLYYGGLLRYWPHLTPDACRTALADPEGVAASYPALDPDPAAVRARVQAERPIADSALGWRPAAARGRATIAVTAATVHVPPVSMKMRVAVRNVFDWIPTSVSVAAIVARFDVDGIGADAVPPARQGAPVTAVKRHATSYGPRASGPLTAFLARPVRRETVSFALAREGVDDEQFAPGVAGKQVPYAFLTVYADGRYEVVADWREDDRVGFGQVAEEVAAVVAPVIGAINAMGAAAFPIGGELAMPKTTGAAAAAPLAASPALGAITVSAFWPHALTAATFREVKSRFRAYERAGIIGIRGLQQAAAYVFSFRKGVTAYDPRLADRAATADAPGRHASANQYLRLADQGAAARWAAAFPGRTVRVYHRATDLRVEILGADSLAEFEMIQRYVFAFLDGLLSGPGRIRVGEAAAPPAPNEETHVASARLRRLQERDPNLFDLKKYDTDATSYSILCQSGRQPYIFSEQEAGRLAARRRGRLVRYWNFTEAAPALYECPDPKFPHLSFRAGQHPLGYCLPCCKKTLPAAGSRAALLNAGCLRDRGPPGPDAAPEPEPGATSRHVLTYGKEVPLGRVSDAPRELTAGLLLDAVPPPHGVYLIGVEQAAPAVPYAGFAYSLAYAAGIGDATVDEVLSDLAELARGLGGTFFTVGGGGGAAFASAADLADAILGAFVRRDPGLSPFGPGGAAADTWPAILAELARLAYGIEVVTARDAAGDGVITLEASPEAAAAICLSGGAACGAYVPPRIAIIVEGPMGTYPAAALNPKLYVRAAHAHRWMGARRSFAEPPPARGGPPADAVEDRVAAAIRAALSSALPPAPAAPDLAAVTRFVCSSGGAYTVVERLADMHGLCYAVVLRAAGGSLVYFAVRRSACPTDGTPSRYGARPEMALPRQALASAVEAFNNFLDTAPATESHPRITPAATLKDPTGRIVGFAHTAGRDTLFYYHDPEPAESDKSGLAAIPLPYDPRAVDAAIVAATAGRRRDGDAGPPTEEPAQAARAKNRLYRLFLAEFSSTLRADRNLAMRASIEAILRATNFESPKSVANLRRSLAGLLAGHPEDLAAVRDGIARAHVQSPQSPTAAMIEMLRATAFTFDRQGLTRLRALGSHEAVVAELRKILAPRIEVVPGDTTPAAGNMYVACAAPGGEPGTHCVARKLAVPRRRIGDFYEILARDVLNPGKAGLLSAMSAGVFDPLDFIRRPGEHLSFSPGGA